LKIASIVIAGRDQEDAERKLRQMYRQCEIVSCKVKSADSRTQQSVSMDRGLSLISK
jgi:exosome complex RNA-binding protein Rrp4